MNYRLAACCFSVCLLLCAARCASAAPLVPPGVAPGSPYHLAFVTSGTRDATSSNISDYNAFVNAQAANNPALTGTNMGVNYFAIGSTTSVDANANAVVSAPVYNLNGDLLATGFADMWDGSLNNPIRYDEFGTPGFPDVWTGTQASGVAFAGQELGAMTPHTGLATQASSLWIDDFTSGSAQNFALYGLSEQLVAPSSQTVPEPGSLVLWLTALLAALGAGRWMQQHRQA